ncbi:MAG: acetyl-CoA carboxylase biotin carboxylase subunit, partial [Flavobacteriales bacterium]
QEDLEIHGHAIELRVYAEDPASGFLPDIGTLTTYKKPEGAGIRVDDGYEEGMDIPIYYDPMIAKLVAHADTREAAIGRLTRAIEDFHITGIKTTLPFGKFAINHESFVSGNFDTHFVKLYFTPEVLDVHKEQEARAAAISAFLFQEAAKNAVKAVPESTVSNWKLRR